MFDKSTQKELKEQYRVLLGDVWGNDSHMIDFCTKKAKVVFKTEKGFFLEVEKTDIKRVGYISYIKLFYIVHPKYFFLPLA